VIASLRGFKSLKGLKCTSLMNATCETFETPETSETNKKPSVKTPGLANHTTRKRAFTSS
jgi:hypothetical protein